MTWRHACGIAALHLENSCLALVVRLSTWRAAHAPETLDPAPVDLWAKIAVRLTPPPPVVGFCCDQAFTSVEAHWVHMQRCRATFSAPVVIPLNPSHQARA
jgi:hypothetical protein